MHVSDTTAYRALQGAGNAFTLLDHGFTVERDLGNSGLYADTALRRAIEAGWIPGPTIVNSGIIIGAFGGQFHENPERGNLVYPEYLNADTNDEIVKAVRQNVHYGAKVIKVCVDCEGYPYTVDQMRLFVSEAANAGLKVACHVQTEKGRAQRHRGRRVVDRAWARPDRRTAADDESQGHVAGRHRWAVHTLSRQPARAST